MKRWAFWVLCVAVTTLGMFTPWGIQQAWALPQFKKAFEDKYIKSGKHPELKAAMRKAACNTCHVKGEPKTTQNSYGEVLNELLDGNAKERLDAAKAISRDEQKAELKRLIEEFTEALAQAEEKQNGGGETYGSRLAAGKLPVDIGQDEGGEDEEEETEAEEGD